MAIAKESIQKIVDEIDFVLDKIDPENPPEESLYFFSAVPATINRVFNIRFDQNLLYAFMVLQLTMDALSNSLKNIQNNPRGGVPGIVAPFHFTRLVAITQEFRDKLNDRKNFDATLKKFLLLAYSVTGNGHYLMQRGLLKP